ncbi:MAG: sensor histidine kinase [Micromonosporaceae bacterium]
MTLLVIVAGYAAWLTFDDGLRLRDVRAMHEQVYVPTVAMVTELQRERLLTAELAADDSKARRRDLTEQRAATDRTVDKFRTRAGRDAGASSRVDDAVSRLSRIDSARRHLDDGSGGRAGEDYTSVVASALLVLDAMTSNETLIVGAQQRTLTALQHATENLSRQGALLGGVLAAGGDLTPADYRTFVALDGATDSWLDAVRAQVRGEDRIRFRTVAKSDEWSTLREMVAAVDVPAENSEPLPGEVVQLAIPFESEDWSRTLTAVLGQFRALDTDLADIMVAASTEAADTLLWRAGMITAGGVLLIVILMLVWIVVAPKHVVGSLAELRSTSAMFAERLPGVVRRLEDGHPVDVDEAAQPVEFGPDEFGDVGRGINHLMAVAVTSTVSAKEQKNTKDVIASLARRHQGLISEQLKALTAIQNDVQEPDLLRKLFALDQRVTQTRRYNYNLMILAGEPPPRLRKKPVSMWDVMRAATQEVTHYKRVAVRQVDGVALIGPAYADVTHLLAELIENATVFSPPHTKVTVAGELVTNGFVIEVEDSGIGIPDDELPTHNERLASPPTARIHPDVTQLGLFVVNRLAVNRGVKVTLRRSPYGGTTAIVLIPQNLLTDVSPDVLTSLNRQRSSSAGRR